MRASITLLLFAANIAAAQTPATTAKAFGVIDGIAVDSLHRDVLRGAFLTVEGSSASAFSDSSGRFRIDSVPPGSHRIEVVHPLLDSLGIRLRTVELKVEAGGELHIVVAAPSAQTVVATQCTLSERRLGPAALLGTVLFADSESPAEGSQVILEWIELSVSQKKFHSTPFRRTATVASNGRFKLCGLPGDLNGSLIAVRGQDSSASIGVTLPSLVGVVGFGLPEPLARGHVGSATLTGRVLDPTGTGLPRARVSINGDSAVASTDADGRFVLRNLRSGTRVLSVRRLGFQPTEVPVNLLTRVPVDVIVKLEKFVVVLDTVRVIAFRDIALDRVGFSRRKKSGMGYYMTPDDIARRHAFDLAGLLSMAPMLRRSYSGGRAIITGRPFGIGGGCVTWWLDDSPWLGGGIEDVIHPDEIVAVEVYSASFAPAQYRRFGNCETVVLWTTMKIH